MMFHSRVRAMARPEPVLDCDPAATVTADGTKIGIEFAAREMRARRLVPSRVRAHGESLIIRMEARMG